MDQLVEPCLFPQTPSQSMLRYADCKLYKKNNVLYLLHRGGAFLIPVIELDETSNRGRILAAYCIHMVMSGKYRTMLRSREHMETLSKTERLHKPKDYSDYEDEYYYG